MFTSGPIALSSFEKPLVPSKMKAGVVDGFGCFPDRLPPERNSNTFIPDDFQHEIATNFLVRDKGLVVITSCSHRGVVNTVKQAQVVSGVPKVHAIIGRDGAVQSVALISGTPLLAQAVTDAVLQWKYQPASIGGQAVTAEEDVVVVFKIVKQTAGPK